MLAPLKADGTKQASAASSVASHHEVVHDDAEGQELQRLRGEGRYGGGVGVEAVDRDLPKAHGTLPMHAAGSSASPALLARCPRGVLFCGARTWAAARGWVAARATVWSQVLARKLGSL